MEFLGEFFFFKKKKAWLGLTLCLLSGREGDWDLVKIQEANLLDVDKVGSTPSSPAVGRLGLARILGLFRVSGANSVSGTRQRWRRL